MRRSLVLIMSLACALALVSCGGKGGKKAGSAVTEDGKVAFAGLPLVDYPLVLAERASVKLTARE